MANSHDHDHDHSHDHSHDCGHDHDHSHDHDGGHDHDHSHDHDHDDDGPHWQVLAGPAERRERGGGAKGVADEVFNPCEANAVRTGAAAAAKRGPKKIKHK